VRVWIPKPTFLTGDSRENGEGVEKREIAGEKSGKREIGGGRVHKGKLPHAKSAKDAKAQDGPPAFSTRGNGESGDQNQFLPSFAIVGAFA
jgi:hypothetical protein